MSEEFYRKKKKNFRENSKINSNDKDAQENHISKPVIIKAEAYKTIILYASRYANRALPPSNWKEIYGVLTGYSDNDFVYVENAYALTFGHDADVQLDNRHYVFISEIEDKLYSENKGHYVVGWFHSHPGLSLFFSDIDLRNQLWFQEKNPDFCGLVFDHTLLGKKKKEKIGDNILTKYDTGFEIYRISDINIDINSPEFENNYHTVDYIVKGLNKYLFANVLSELSALVSSGKPLQSAYKEETELTKDYKDFEEVENNNRKSSKINIDSNNLAEIPMNEDFSLGFTNLFYDTNNTERDSKFNKSKEQADHLIYLGNQAFQEKDTFTGVEKYRQGINKYKELNDFERVLDLLRTVSKLCVSNNHLVLAEEFATELFNISKQKEKKFYLGIACYTLGYILLKEKTNTSLKVALKKIEDAAIYFGNVMDYAGAGMCYNKIGTIYQTRLTNYDSACLFFKEAIENYNRAIIYNHPLRKALWSKAELLIEKIRELQDLIEELIPNIVSSKIKEKIIRELKAISYNF